MESIKRENLSAFAQSFMATLTPQQNRATIVAFQGELGAGKTTFVQTLAKELGVGGVVQSPTYVLMRKYDISYRSFTTLIHIDAYRLEEPEQFLQLKPETFLHDPAALVVVEWPERLSGVLPQPDKIIRFSADGAESGERYIEVI